MHSGHMGFGLQKHEWPLEKNYDILAVRYQVSTTHPQMKLIASLCYHTVKYEDRALNEQNLTPEIQPDNRKCQCGQYNPGADQCSQ